MTTVKRSITAAVLIALTFSPLAVPAREFCPAFPPPTGPVIDVDPSQVAHLPGIVASASAGSTIRLASGTYNLAGRQLVFRTPNVTLRSATGSRDDVVLDGAYASPEIISIFASNVTVTDVTVKRAYNHPIHITPPVGANITGTRIYNVRVSDPGQQAIKINPTDGTNSADDGAIECSVVELTDLGRTFVRDSCYTGGIDAHRAHDWRVADNTIQGFWCQHGLSEHGIHFWRASADTLVERNQLINNARGIGFGLGSAPGDGHVNGIIRNNFIATTDDRVFASEAGFDLGIGLERAANAKVLHNTVVSTAAPFSSIEWRWPATTATITNNLASHNFRPRDGASAALAGNLSSAPLSLFVDVTAGDLHLRSDASGVDQGVVLPVGDADEDIDGDSRVGVGRDVGADQRVEAMATLTIERSGTGAGRVTSDDRRIDCGPTCSATYPLDVTVTLTAWADAGSTFTGWNGAGCGPTVDMSADRACTATFSASGALIAPSTLIGEVSGRTITLRWRDNSSQEEGFFIERSRNGGPFRRVAEVGLDQTTYAQRVTRGTYQYRVRAFNRTTRERSPYSNVVQMTVN